MTGNDYRFVNKPFYDKISKNSLVILRGIPSCSKFVYVAKKAESA